MKNGSGKLTAGYVRSFRRLSDFEKNHTASLYGGFCVTAFRRTRQGFSSLSPNYNPADDCVTYRNLLRYSKTGTPLLLLTHSASDDMNDVTAPCHPTQRSGDRKELGLSTLHENKNLLLAKQE